ncbi:hypothetical protein M2271_003045 [Streptomyces sp. LBL]|uniref:hypothetical protein n=1 Tax=Streptomyces sp. LBL TaxID=2940562 RepID=UPI002474020B|nr:hypothetical protein [Streptomyces sp. LBL]MDH6625241.1 hypothetical protein [Streptomyces sp. LBL]
MSPYRLGASGKLLLSQARQVEAAALADQKVQEAGEWGRLPAGTTVTKGAVLFPRLEEKPDA